MTTRKIGVDVSDLRLAPRDAFRQAADLRFDYAQFAAGQGELSPSQLSGSGRRNLSHYVGGLGIHLAALSADMPGLRLADPETVQERVERTCAVLELASDLGVPMVSASISQVIQPQTETPDPLVVEALCRIGEVANARATILALRPSLSTIRDLTVLLNEVGCPSIRIDLDPAAMVMHGVSPQDVVEHLPDQIALLQARDGTAGTGERSGRETRLGEGEVDLVGLFACLDAAEYPGPYILRRTDSADPRSDLAEGRHVLQGLLSSDPR